MKRHRLALLTAAMMLMTVLGAAPALADGATTWEYSRGLTFPRGVTELEVARLSLPDPVGSECIAVLSVTNPDSKHPGNILKLNQGTTLLLSIPDFEDVPGTITDSTGFIATGDDLVVVIERGQHRTTSSFGSLTVTCEPPDNGGGGEGCTPGYWKQEHHFDSWMGYDQDGSFAGIFLVPYDKTLLEALQTGGGKDKALGRHAVAALLNASSDGVDYAYSVDEVIALVQDAYATGDFNGVKGMLEAENEAGCPLN